MSTIGSRAPSRSFSCAQMTGARMEADKPPALLEGETFVPGGSLTGVSLFDSPLHPSEVIHPKAELGTIWVTNFRTILRFYETGEFSIPHGNVVRVTKEGMDAAEIRDHVSFYCRDMSAEFVGLPVKMRHDDRGPEVENKGRRDVLKAISKYCNVKAVKKLFAFSHPSSTYTTNGWCIFDLAKEFERQGVTLTGNQNWKVSNANMKYDLCNTYPPKLIVPQPISEDAMFNLAQIRVKGRVPSLTWHSKSNGAVLIRASQFNLVQDDMTGFAGSSAKTDLVFMKAILTQMNPDKIFVYDTCSKKDFPSHLYTGDIYINSTIFEQLGLPSEQTIFDTLKVLSNICTGNMSILDTERWLEDIDKSNWLQYLSKLLGSACKISSCLEAGNPVIVQSESGVNLLSVISSMTQLLLDPYYRTVEGFCVLIEKDFIFFGHKFGNFIGKKLTDEHSCIFLMFLDAVWQTMQQFPLAFQFREDFLLYLLHAVYSCQFGTFLPSCMKERGEYEKKTASVWSYVFDSQDEFYNPLYEPTEERLALQPERSRLRIWSAFYLRHKCRFSLLKADKSLRTAVSKCVDVIELSSLKIPALPFALVSSNMEHITDLNLNDNLLNKIPLSLVSATKLRTLRLSDNQIPFIASSFLEKFTSNVTNLEILDLNHNQLLELSDLICRFKQLRALKVHNNLLKALPPLEQFEDLVELDIGGNEIAEIPDEVYHLRNLETLDVSDNPAVTVLPNSLVDLSHLSTLNISRTSIKALPSDFDKLTNLTSLDISDVQLEQFPSMIFQFTNLVRLSMGSLALKDIPAELNMLPGLEYLDLSSNGISVLPESLLDLINLKCLILSHNLLKNIPLDISKLDQLVELHLENNKLVDLTPGVGKLDQLRILNVSYNNITSFPGTIGYLEKLERSGNFFYTKNPLNSSLTEVISAGNAKLFEHLRSLLEGEQQIYRMKIMLVGQENVGKTSLLRCLSDYIDNGRKINSSAGIDKTLSNATGLTSMSTDGIDIGDLNFKILFKQENHKKKTQVDLSVWDFAGQEIYYTTHQFFLSDRALYIVVWNMAKKEEDSRVEYWLKSIAARAPDAPIILVGTHADHRICTKEYVDDTLKALENKYCTEYGNIQTIHTISCANMEGIQKLDLWIQGIVVSQPYMGEKIQRSFLELEKLCKQEKAKRVPPVVTWKMFSRFGFICNIKTQESLNEAAEWLHNMGSIIYFQKHEGLNDIVILDPQWLTDVMSTIITTKHAFVKNGVLQHADLPQLWRAPDFPPYLHRTLLNLLEKFEISFYLRSTQEETDDKSMAMYTGRSLVPSLLPDARPAIEKFWSHFPDSGERQFGRRYVFGFIPHGFISRLFVRVLHFAEPTVFWKNGMLVEYNEDAKSHTVSSKLIEGNFAILIEAQPAQRYVDITIRGTAEKLAQLIMETIDSLIVGWYSVTVEVKVPCIHCIRNSDYSPYMFPMEDCEQAAIDGKAFIKCLNIRDIRLDELVPDVAMIHVADCRLAHNELHIEKEIGVGGFAVVYKGTYQDKVVAIKKIKFGDNTEVSLDETTELEAFAEFRREVWLMSGLFHLNIVQMEGFTVDPFCIITEFIPHGNLYDLIHDKERELSWGYRWRCAMDMAKGMKYLHTTSWPPIIHRDLKTPNVLISSLDERAEVIAKVADFGLSQVLASTTQGRSVANPVWLAPEIMKNEEYTEKADVYSYGVMLYELASREDFFGDTTFMSQLENRVIEGERPIIPSDTPTEFAELITRCWDGDPEKRPPFYEVVDKLREGMEVYHPELVEIACADKDIAPVRKTNAKSDGTRRKARTVEEIEAERKAMEIARKEQYTKEMNEISHTLNQLHDASIQCMVYLPPCTGRPAPQVWSGASDGVINVWSVDGNMIESINAHTKSIYMMLVVGETVWTVSGDSVIRVYLARNARLKKEIKNAPILCLENVGTKQVWGGSIESYIHVYDAKKKKFRAIEGGPILCLKHVESTGCVWAGTDLPGKRIMVYNSKFKPVFENGLEGHNKRVNAIIESNGLIWSCSHDKTIMIWNSEGESIRILQGHTGPIITIVPIGTHVWSGSWDKRIILWDAEYQQFFKEFEAHEDLISSIISLRENKHVWSGSYDRTIRAWEKTPSST